MKMALKKTLKGSLFTRVALFALACGVSMPVNAATVYMSNFQNDDVAGWSSIDNTIGITQVPNDDFVRKFLGEFSNGTVSLSLAGLPEHATTTVSFSLYLIRSWDGNDATVINNDPLGPDTWGLSVAGGPTLLNTTFSNGNSVAGQNYDGAFSTYTYTPWTPCDAYADYSGPGNGPMTGANECYSLGYTFTDDNVTDESMDSVYNLSFMFAHNASDLVLNFSAAGLQGIADESWGLNNVQVEVSAVPVPAAVWLFGSGLLGLIVIARKKK